MRRRWFVAAWISAMVAGGPAFACRAPLAIRLEDVARADLVVVGRVTQYEVVRKPSLLPGERPGTLSDHATFLVRTEEVLAGQAPARLAVRWDNSTFAEPDALPEGPFLIALSRPTGAASNPEAYTLFQAACSDPFLFEAASDRARAVREILARNHKTDGEKR
ncbi:hypothetical protein [Caulobacter endophyticus]|uniref:hypothetical protein n=1 Tax=Caulobacter endophyticus TaxID=2172652 RepID=UPI002410ACBE|nr:hypothetical protein [Caulobacter endophyticus]MDG2530594.1 hypothetical protein [Caulobacter endophyticus]